MKTEKELLSRVHPTWNIGYAGYNVYWKQMRRVMPLFKQIRLSSLEYNLTIEFSWEKDGDKVLYCVINRKDLYFQTSVEIARLFWNDLIQEGFKEWNL
jgi:hypothetical protein